MKDIFLKNNRKKKLKNQIYFYAFYTILLYLFSVMIIAVSKNTEICLFDWYCVSSKKQFLQAGFILYIYLLFIAILMIQTYKWLEKLVSHKNHIAYFRYIFYAITPMVYIMIKWFGKIDENSILLIIFSAIISVLGLLMLAFRKK